MFKILLDSSNKDLYVALLKNDKLIDEITYEAWQRQSEYMVVELEKLLNRNHVDKKDIDGVIVGIGPGSYTGVRISLTIAKTICLALNIPAYPASSLALLANYDTPSICLINARSKRSYFGVYHLGKALVEDCVISNDEVLNYINEHPTYSIIGEAKHINLVDKKPQIGANIEKLLKNLTASENALVIKPKYLKD